MAKDLDVIRELEAELGQSIPITELKRLTYGVCLGLVVDEFENVIGLGLDRSRIREKGFSEKAIYLITKLKHLTQLSLAGNNLVRVPKDFVSLDKLERLQLYDNKIEIFPSHLLELPKLKHLGLAQNKIKKLPRNVIDFDLNLYQGVSEDGICLLGNHLEIPPLEIVEQGNEAVRNYFAQIEQAKGQTQYLFEAKLLIIGDGGTGKTSFKRKIRNPAARLPRDKDTTLGIEVDTWSYPIQFSQNPNLEDVKFHVNLWDFGGQKIYRGTHQIFITDPSVIRTLSGYFCRIGVFTHYIDDSLLQERIYLDSNWLVNTVYKVLDNKQVKATKGRLEEKDINNIWQTNELNFEIDKLTQLMHKFGLMYHISGSKSYVVPEHLPTNQPYEEWEHQSASDILYFTYEFDKYMPKGLMSRLIVSLHRDIKNHDYVWNRGLNIELKGTHGEIIETYGSSNTFQIRIAGANKIELLTIIRQRFAEVLQPFRNLNYKQLVPCTCDECSIAPIPQFHDYNKLLNLRAKGTGSQCPKSGEIVEITDLLRITEFIKDEDEVVDDAEAKVSSDLKTIELFLASSKELKSDREQVEILVNRENKKLVKKGLFLQLNLWEDFLDAMSKTRLQDDYNKMVKQSDIFISLFATKVGNFSEEEFEVAHTNFQEVGKPKYIFTYFKDVQINVSDMSIEDLISLENFKGKLDKLGHFYTSYKSIEDLNRQLKNQLDKIIEV